MSHSLAAFANVETPRLRLRPPDEGDLDAVIRIHGDPATNRFNPKGPASPDQCAGMLRSWMGHWQAHGFGYWVVEARDRRGHVHGFGGLGTREGSPRLNLYFRLDPEVWGRGLSTELGRKAIELAFSCPAWTEVWGEVRQSNLPSRRALERLGMQERSRVEHDDGTEPSVLMSVIRAATAHAAGVGHGRSPGHGPA